LNLRLVAPSAGRGERGETMAATELTPSTRPLVSPPHPKSAGGIRLQLPLELRRTSGSSVVARWLTSRALTLALAVTIEPSVTGDVAYYGRSLHTLFHGGSIREVLQEYPLPVLAIMLPQYLVAATNALAFALLFSASMLVVDALFTWSLWRASGRTRGAALTFWLWFVPAVGPIAYFRFDLVPAMLAGAAVLVAARRPGWSGSLTAIGAGLKLWPALMLPTFLLRKVDRRRVLVGFTLTGVAIAGSALLIGGVGRLVSPLTWQNDRGLQIESVSATPLVLARLFHRHHVWSSHVSKYKAFEIFGWGVSAMLISSTVATVAGLLFLAKLWLRARKLPEVTPDVLGWLFLATSVVVTITNKALSPQYILWLGGPLAALWVRTPGDPSVRRAGILLLVIALLTQGVYPITYPALISARGVTPILSTMLLASRNVLLVVLAWQACKQVWLRTKPDDSVLAAAEPIDAVTVDAVAIDAVAIDAVAVDASAIDPVTIEALASAAPTVSTVSTAGTTGT
jgi:Glycosyltransferase family 87